MKHNFRYFGPDNADILNRVPYCFLVMAAFFLVLQIIGNSLLKTYPTALDDPTKCVINVSIYTLPTTAMLML